MKKSRDVSKTLRYNSIYIQAAHISHSTAVRFRYVSRRLNNFREGHERGLKASRDNWYRDGLLLWLRGMAAMIALFSVVLPCVLCAVRLIELSGMWACRPTPEAHTSGL